ncbi:hypothetical protein V5H42_25780, partial [Salmonella enterica]
TPVLLTPYFLSIRRIASLPQPRDAVHFPQTFITSVLKRKKVLTPVLLTPYFLSIRRIASLPQPRDAVHFPQTFI